jgi:lysophospholipase L1-like esterase
VAWPRLLGVTAADHLACSGARTTALFEPQGTTDPDATSQLVRLGGINLRAPVDAVLITVGGNDIGFSAIVGDCYLRRCLAHPRVNDRQIDQLATNLRDKVLPAIAQTAPAGRIILVGYPRVFPETHAETTHCGWLTPQEQADANELATYLDRQEQQAALGAHVEYVSVLNAFNGHELCSRSPWLHDVSARDCEPLAPAATRSFCGHPVEKGSEHGQRAIADIVSRTLNNGAPPPCTAAALGAHDDQLVNLDTKSFSDVRCEGDYAIANYSPPGYARSLPWEVAYRSQGGQWAHVGDSFPGTGHGVFQPVTGVPQPVCTDLHVVAECVG